VSQLLHERVLVHPLCISCRSFQPMAFFQPHHKRMGPVGWVWVIIWCNLATMGTHIVAARPDQMGTLAPMGTHVVLWPSQKPQNC
jgi:hypothetical protein